MKRTLASILKTQKTRDTSVHLAVPITYYPLEAYFFLHQCCFCISLSYTLILNPSIIVYVLLKPILVKSRINHLSSETMLCNNDHLHNSISFRKKNVIQVIKS